jgi:hypothetical protein
MTDHPQDPIWRKSSFSGPNGGTCVEIAATDDGVLVRNSNRPDAGTIAFTRAELAAWIDGCKAGEFDDLH